MKSYTVLIDTSIKYYEITINTDDSSKIIENFILNDPTFKKYDIYDLKGAFVRSVRGKCLEECTRGLTTGLYIINGRKVMIR